ncbi:MAG: VCBS repeat-containing protein [Alphaproteobacteria bacterium]|nr:VCBS repeat-containing protein [Alphaproteobacteria bacterium]
MTQTTVTFDPAQVTDGTAGGGTGDNVLSAGGLTFTIAANGAWTADFTSNRFNFAEDPAHGGENFTITVTYPGAVFDMADYDIYVDMTPVTVGGWNATMFVSSHGGSTGWDSAGGPGPFNYQTAWGFAGFAISHAASLSIADATIPGQSFSGTATIYFDNIVVDYALTNNPPIANDDTPTVAEDSGATVINVLANDSTAPDTGETLTVTAVTQPANGTVTLTGGVVRFTPAANFSGATSFTYTVSDGNGGIDTATVNMTVSAVNDAPVVTAPASISVTEDVASFVTGISFADVDAGSASVTATLSVATGQLSATSGSGVTVSGSGTGTLGLTGSIANINNFIAGSNLSYLTASNATGSVTLNVSINDGGSTGTGGAQTGTGSTTLNISAVNDAITGLPSNSPIAHTENTAPTSLFGDLTLADPDNPANLSGGSLSASLLNPAAGDALVLLPGAFSVSGATVSYIGTAIGTIGSGGFNTTAVTVSFNSNATVSIVEQLTEALAYTTTSDDPTEGNTHNTRMISVTVDDGGNTGSGGAQSVSSTAAVLLTAVNDAPVISVQGTVDIVVAGRASLDTFLSDGVGNYAAAGATSRDYAWKVLLGDMNGDGMLDAVNTNLNAGTLSVALGDGKGGFAAPVSYGSDYYYGAALGDVDGDGDLDVIVGRANSQAVAVLANNGDGTLAAATSYTVGSIPYDIQLGDLDGDGDLDIVATNLNSNTVSVLKGDGVGAFAAATTLATGTLPDSSALGDVDGDGDLDVVTANQNSNTISVFVNNGIGGFSGGSQFSAGSDISSVVLGDFDEDGDLDAVTSSYTTVGMSLLLGNGHGGFAAPVSVATGARAYSLAVFDYDGDGHLDILSADSGGFDFKILLGDGVGGFAAPITRTTPYFTLGFAFGNVDTAQVTDEDTAIVFDAAHGNAIAVSDVDAGVGDETVTLGVAHGDLTLATTAGLTSFTGDGTGSVTLTGSIAELNAALDGLTYTPDADYNGTDSLSVAIDDNGNTGGGALTDSAPVPISVTAVNDAPGVTGLPASIAFTEDTQGSLDIAASSFADVDDASITVTLAVTHGTLGLAAPGGIAVSLGGNGTATVTLTGAPADINSYLDTASNVTFSPESAFTGHSTLTVSAADGAGTTQLGTVTLDVAEQDSLVVTTLSDVVDAFDGETSLREAVTYANGHAGADTITFDAALNGTVRLDGGDGAGGTAGGTLNVTGALTIDGDGRITVSGDVNADDVHQSGSTVLTDIAASQTAAKVADNVQIIQAAGTDVTVDGLTLTGGVSAFNGGAIQADHVTLIDSTLTGNSAPLRGGGAYGQGSGIAVSATGSAVYGNMASAGGGLNSNDSMSLTNTTVAGNTASNFGGGVVASTLTLTSTTITGNSGGVQGGAFVAGLTTLTNSIVLGNTAQNDVESFIGGGPVLAGGNILGVNVYAGTTRIGTTTVSDVFAQTQDLGGGVLGGVVANNGGTVWTVALNTAATNPALDAADGSAPATDARGEGRLDHSGIANATGGSGADIGAFEANVNQEPAGTDATLTVDEDSYHTFTAADFGFTDSDGDNLGGVVVTTLPAHGALWLDTGLALAAVQAGDTVSRADIDAGNLVFLPDAEESGTSYAGFTFQVVDDGGTAGGGVDTDATANTITFDVTAVDDAPRIFLQPALDVVTALPFDDVVDIVSGDGEGFFIGESPEFADVGAGPGAVAVSDFDGDGLLDIAYANTFQDTVTILLGDGCGCFTESASSPLAVGDAPVAIVVADVNGDTEDDLLVVNADGASVSVRLGDGLGGFTNGVTVASAATPVALAAADFDGDGDIDFATANDSGASVTVALNLGTGVFTASGKAVGGAIVTGIAAGDLDGDGNQDLVITDAAGSLMKVLAGNGDGTFTTGGSFAVGAGANDIALGDFDGDGVLDAAVANAADGTGSVLLGNGDGSFAAQAVYTVGDTPATLALADMNADGHLDIVVGDQTTDDLELLLGAGDGSFTSNDITPPLGFITDIAIGNMDPDAEDSYPLAKEFHEGSTLALAPRLVLSDIDSTLIQGATVFLDSVGGPGGLAGDVLAATVSRAGITATWNAGTFTLSFSGAASVADYQAVLRGVTFASGSDPDAGGTVLLRVIGITVDDGGPGGPATAAPIFLAINSVTDDGVVTQENAVLNGDVFAANPTLPDNTFPAVVTAVNGVGASVGQQITLASGALLTLNADGTFSYDPNGKFDYLPSFATSGASNTTATDSFSYTVAGGSTATVTVTIRGVDSYDRVLGSTGDDILRGGLFDDVMYGFTGADQMRGGAGDDVYFVDQAGDRVFEELNQGTDTVYSAVSRTLGDHLEVLRLTGTGDLDGNGNGLRNYLFGNAGANQLQGFGGDDALRGNDGDDRLDGGTGADMMRGGAGNDVYFVDDAGDRTFEDAGQGIDMVYASLSWTLADETENLRLTGLGNLMGTGNAAANLIFGGDGNDLLQGLGENDVLNAGLGNDRLDGGAGIDQMRGGLGNDIYYADRAGDKVLEEQNEGTDTVYAGASFALSAEVENLRLTGTGDFIGNGNDLRNVMSGNAGANVLQGFGGNDELDGAAGADDVRGGDGDDLLSGGLGADQLDGGAGNDWLRGGADGDLFRFIRTNAGIDTISDFDTANDRFDLRGGRFASASEANGNTVLHHDGGTILVLGVTGLTLGAWNALAGVTSLSRLAADAHPIATLQGFDSAGDTPGPLAEAVAATLLPLPTLGTFEHTHLNPTDFLFV